jgi:LmbE family N-acetylglucosaminyl deacetylase
MKILDPENWDTQQEILVVLAHPDDPEFFCGATISRWVAAGHKVNYCLFTSGDKGVNATNTKTENLTSIREKEQLSAANVLGVSSVQFLDFEDGYLIADIPARKKIVGVIREIQPSILVSCDPTNVFVREDSINHPDHIAAGQITINAVYPAAGNPLFFPDLLENGLTPHSVKEVWLSLPANPNTILDVTEFWEKKIDALLCHVSQVGNLKEFSERMKSRKTPDSLESSPRYEEKFKRIIFKQHG